MATDMKRSYRDTVVCDEEFKIIVIGNPDVGKTSLILRLVDNKFNDKKSPTYGMDQRDVIVLKNDNRIRFQIWDTAGQQTYRHVTANFINGCQGVILVFDLTSLNSFLALEDWMATVQEKAGAKVIIHLFGNKCDLPAESHQVKKEQIDRFMKVHRIKNYTPVG